MADLEELMPVVEHISRMTASDYPDIEWEDVRQHLCLFILEKADALKYEGNGGSVKSILKKVAKDFCKKERAQQNFLSSQYSYRPSDVKKILESAFDQEGLDKTYVPEDARSVKSAMDEVEIASDVRDAFLRLAPDYQISLFMRYAMREVPAHASYERKRLNKAVNELTRILNSYRGRGPFVGRRTIVSNSTAQTIISKDW